MMINNKTYNLFTILTVMSVLLMACQYRNKKQGTVQHPSVENTEKLSKTIPDMDVPDFNRNDVSLLGEIKKNRITVIDFWASWCGPCMQEMPAMKEMYRIYHHLGMEIIGISLDSDFHAWKNTVENNGLSWKHLSELRGWDSFAAKKMQCNIHSIHYCC